VRVLACLPALLIAALIWWASSTPDLAVASGVLDTVLRKAAHVGAFAALALACVLGLRANGVRATAAISIGALIALGYAAIDELHQSTVPTRDGAVTDVLIDAIGVGLAALALMRRARRAVPC
jgi:VanZ family protein